MQNKTAVVDESGDPGLTKKSSENFINTAVIVDDISKLERIAKRVYKKKVLNKHKKDQLHANKDNYKIHKAIIKELDSLDYKAIFINEKNYLLNLEKMFTRLKELNVGTVYLSIRDSRKSTLKKIVELAAAQNIRIIFSSPTNTKALQIVDFVSWAIFRKLEYNDDLYFLKIKFPKK